MSADYQALMLFLIAMSFIMHDLVFVPTVSISKVYFVLTMVGAAIIVVCTRFIELPVNQTTLLVVSFTVFTGLYGGTAECLLKDFLQSKVMRFAYLAHIGLWSGLLTWSTRWLF